ncbi:hypothetical protein FMM68_09760 [Lachnospiraceae bacterium MD329]|nr:hypothetical protein [Lachnospiraceae bacterium MD329]
MNEQQIRLLKKIGLDIDTELDILEEAVGDYFNLHCLDENYIPNEDGLICESILDYIENSDNL